MFLAVTSDTWIVTGLGFGIVLALLICLVVILLLFGWIMQRATAPKAPKAPEQPKVESQPTKADALPTEPEKAAIAMAVASAADDDKAAIAMALYLARQNSKHDIPTAMIKAQARETAWNTKSIGLNNIGF